MRMFAIAAAGLLLCSPTFAQTATNSPSQQNSAMPQAQQDSQGNFQGNVQGNSQGNSQSIAPQAQNEQTTTEIADQLTNKLAQAGFKNIKLIPSGFIVRADDQNNNPVVMIVNPGSITTVAGPQEAQGGNNDHRTVGQGSSGQGMNGSGSSNSNELTQQPQQPSH